MQRLRLFNNLEEAATCISLPSPKIFRDGCFSAGWVGCEKGEITEQFLERADRTLYAEKRVGKTREKELLAVS